MTEFGPVFTLLLALIGLIAAGTTLVAPRVIVISTLVSKNTRDQMDPIALGVCAVLCLAEICFLIDELFTAFR